MMRDGDQSGLTDSYLQTKHAVYVVNMCVDMGRRQVTDILAVGAGGDGELRPAIDMGVTFRTGSGSPWLADAETTAVAVDTVVRNPSCPAASSPSPSASELSE